MDQSLKFLPGANSAMGIGRASAHQFAESGAKAIYICDYDGSNLESHKKEINAAYPSVEVHTRQFDAADEKEVKAVVDDALAKYKRLDVFFANAGVAGKSTLFTDFDDNEFMSIMKTNTLRYVACPMSIFSHALFTNPCAAYSLLPSTPPLP